MVIVLLLEVILNRVFVLICVLVVLLCGFLVCL